MTVARAGVAVHSSTTSTKMDPNSIKVLLAAGQPAAAAAGYNLYTWGENTWGQIGNGTSINHVNPNQIGALNDWAQIASHSGATHAIARKTNGTLWAWGAGTSGRLGDGSTVTKSSPVQIGALSDWAQVAAGSFHSLAVKTNGTLWAWGAGGSGRLGDGTTVSKSSPVQIGALSDWAQVAAGNIHSLAVKTNGTLWAWGGGGSGQLGDGSAVSKSSPVQIGALSDWEELSLYIANANSSGALKL